MVIISFASVAFYHILQGSYIFIVKQKWKIADVSNEYKFFENTGRICRATLLWNYNFYVHNNWKIHSRKFSLYCKWQEKTEKEKIIGYEITLRDKSWRKLNQIWNLKKRKTKYLFYFILIAPWKLHTPSSKMHKL